MKNSTRFDVIVVVLTIIVSGSLIFSRIVYHRNNIKRKETYERKEMNVRHQVPNIPAAPSSEKIAPPETETRNILFKHRNPSAKKVSIVGDFNDWMPQDMKKAQNGIWTVTIKIAPGQYVYNFIVDGRPQKDVNNPKTTDTGRGFPGSYLDVKPLEKN